MRDNGTHKIRTPQRQVDRDGRRDADAHGDHDPTDPSRSLLYLHDHKSAPLTVASVASINLEYAQLAYLSACNTALSMDVDLLDEAIHLTSTFQLAGFRHVVGTLWTIDDDIAVEIARDFYTALYDARGALNTAHAAYALHHAVRQQRNQLPDTPSLWAAYIHAGA